MNLSCETIINENEKLKLSDLEKSCLNIFDYLNLHHKIEFLKIDIKKNEKIENLFSSCDIKTDYFINTLDFKQNCDTEIIFSFLSKTQEEYESLTKNADNQGLTVPCYIKSVVLEDDYFYGFYKKRAY